MSYSEKLKLIEERDKLQDLYRCKIDRFNHLSVEIKKLSESVDNQINVIKNNIQNQNNEMETKEYETELKEIHSEIKAEKFNSEDMDCSKNLKSIDNKIAFQNTALKENNSDSEYDDYLDKIERWLEKQEIIVDSQIKRKKDLITKIRSLKNKQCLLKNELSELNDYRKEIEEKEYNLKIGREKLQKKDALTKRYDDLCKQISNYYLHSSQMIEPVDIGINCKIHDNNELLKNYRQKWKENRRLLNQIQLAEEKCLKISQLLEKSFSFYPS